MANEVLNNAKLNQSSLVLANGVTLVSGVIRKIAGNDIASTLNGNRAGKALVESLAAQRIAKTLKIK